MKNFSLFFFEFSCKETFSQYIALENLNVKIIKNPFITASTCCNHNKSFIIPAKRKVINVIIVDIIVITVFLVSTFTKLIVFLFSFFIQNSTNLFNFEVNK